MNGNVVDFDKLTDRTDLVLDCVYRGGSIGGTRDDPLSKLLKVGKDDLNVRYVLQAERMGHEVPGMRGIYKHVAPEWRVDLVNGLQRVWEESLAARAAIAHRSAVSLLDRLLAAI